MTRPNPEVQLLPDSYSPDWIEKLDGRTAIAQAVRARLQALATDAGGELSYQRYSLCKRAVWMEALVEQREAAIARGEVVDEGKLTQAVNTLMGLLKALGLERQVKPANTLQGALATLRNKQEAASAA